MALDVRPLGTDSEIWKTLEQTTLEALPGMREANPMPGLRAVRLSIHLPDLTKMRT